MKGRIALLMVLAVAGCVPKNRERATPVTEVDPKTALPEYWLDQPAVASAQALDFEKLWFACERTLRDRYFKLDRQDQRSGTLTTLPLVSKQPYELWKSDVVTLRDLGQSSLATMRRTVRFDIARLDNGQFQAQPKVLVERQVNSERQIPSVTEYTRSLSGPRVEGDRATDAGTPLPPDYWYPVGRDFELEKSLAKSVNSHLVH